MTTYNSNASKLHVKVGEVLPETDILKAHPAEQEVAVGSLFPSYPNQRERYDWIIRGLKVIIECHGIQHYQFQTFGADAEVALMKWKESLIRDQHKKSIAIENGWTYIEIPYTDIDKVNPQYLLNAYRANFNEEPVLAVIEEDQEADPYKEIQKEKARLARQAHYQFMKRLKEEKKHEDK